MAMRLRFSPILVFCLTVSAFSMPAWPAPDAFDGEHDEKPRAEAEVELPAFPQDGDLIPFEVGSVTDKRFLIDEKSVSVDKDGVIRYSVVVLSSAGARNVSFEGMRCPTGERRVYAFGRNDGTWSKARGSKWAGIRGSENTYPVALFSDYFCVIGQRAVMTPEDAIRVLQYGGDGLAGQ
jgi:hypothetical protein